MFYEILAKYYDEVFPLEKGKVSFLNHVFTEINAKKILDLACGTGTYTLELAKLGFEAWGTDLEPGMVQQAQQKAATLGLNAQFAVGDMREPGALGHTFDGLFCIGNSLAHLLEKRHLEQALLAMHHVVHTQGVAVFQIVNFDRILALGDTNLPLIENETLRFIRTYRPIREDQLVFDSVLELKTGDKGMTRFTNSVQLRPIRKANLEELLKEAGFSQIHTYGNFKQEPYSLDSQATVVIAKP